MIWLLPILNGIFGWFLVERTVKGLLGAVISNPRAILGNWKLSEEDIRLLLGEIDWKGQLEGLIDQRLDRFIVGIKQKIPMAAMFLSGGIVDTLKGLAKEEIYGMLPELQDRLSKTVVDRIEIDRLLEKIDWESVTKGLSKKMLWIQAAGALGGVLLGFVEWAAIIAS